MVGPYHRKRHDPSPFSMERKNLPGRKNGLGPLPGVELSWTTGSVYCDLLGGGALTASDSRTRPVFCYPVTELELRWMAHDMVHNPEWFQANHSSL